MLMVIAGLIPGTIAMTYFFGWGVLFNIEIACGVALLCEASLLLIRGRQISGTLLDLSAIVTAWLLALALPPLAPWWLTALGAFFAIVFGKQLYGGLGYNPFNPAMIGYVVLLISFPREMTQWILPIQLQDQAPSFWQTAQIIFTSHNELGWDAISSATPLDTVKTQLSLDQSITEIRQASIFGYLAGNGWEWINIAYLLGGIWLIYKKIITWHTPVAMLSSLFLIASIFYLFDSSQYLPPSFHLFSGAAMLGAFFIATDPVSSCTSNKGKLLFGAGIGLFTYIIRTWGGYPDAVAFAVLLMNMSAPFIDYYTKPRVYGQAN